MQGNGKRRTVELTLLLVIAAATALAILIARDKMAFLSFYQLPVLIAAYYLGRRQGVMLAVAAVLMVSIYATINPALFTGDPTRGQGVAVFIWGAFTIITAYVVGTLYEAKEAAAEDLKQAYEGLVDILSELIDAVDHYADNHSVRVARNAARLGVAMGLPNDTIENLRVAGLLHDIQKVDVSIEVLRKAAGEHEMAPDTAMRVAKRFGTHGGLLKDVVPLIESYDEHYDGSGTDGASGDEIPLGARVLAVADALDRRMAPSPYGEGMTAAEAVMDIEKLSGSHFDPAVVDALILVFEADGLDA